MKFPKMGGGSKAVWTFSKKTSELGNTGTVPEVPLMTSNIFLGVKKDEGTLL